MAHLTVHVISDGRSAVGIPVYVRVESPLDRGMQAALTDDDGNAIVDLPGDGIIEEIIVAPPARSWGQLIADPRRLAQPTIEVDLTPLPPLTERMWWHDTVGAVANQLPGPIAIGIVDTGCCEHPALRDVSLGGSFVGGRHDPSSHSALDRQGHGSHVAGIITSSSASQGVAGIAQGASVTAVRVFPYGDPAWHGSTASQDDISAAIDYLVEERKCDLINLSLGSTTHSRILEDAIEDAADLGTLCIAAAGNSGGAVDYPARLPAVAAIGALGLYGWAPAGSPSAHLLSVASFRGRYSVANFSPDSPHVNAIAPGVGIISTVLDELGRPSYGVMDGTSMASPAALATLAHVLSSSSEYASLPRTRARFAYAWNALLSHCVDLGFHSSRQGNGLIVVERDAFNDGVDSISEKGS